MKRPMWIFTDIRKRGEGSGLFIALALVAGIPAAIIYALTRIGDPKAQGARSQGVNHGGIRWVRPDRARYWGLSAG